MSAWTPGPWTVVTEGGTYAHGPETERGKAIVRWTGMCMPRQLEGIANAHLIAAAPDLYEALKASLHFMETADVGPPRYVISITRAALAKARGES